jgi:hypothetical protein
MEQKEPETTLLPKLYNAEELRKLFNPPLSLKTVRNMTKARVIPYIKIGRRIYYEPDEVMAQLRKRNAIRARF